MEYYSYGIIPTVLFLMKSITNVKLKAIATLL